MTDRTDPPSAPASDPPSDEELLRRWRAGDRDAGDVLIGRHYRDVRRMVARRLDDAAAVDDVVQEAFTTVVRKRDAFEAGFRPYVFWVAKLKLLERYRERDRGGEPLDRDSLLRGASGRFSSLLHRAHGLDAAIQAFAQLDVEEQCLLAWKHFDDRTQQELATQHGVNEAQMAGRLKRARDRWRAAYQAIASSGAAGPTHELDLDAWLESMYGRSSG